MAGDPRTGWGYRLYTEKSYLHHYGKAGHIPPPANGQDDIDHFGHWVIAFGQDSTGGVLVGDPLSTIGTIAVTSEAIDEYFSEWPIMTAALALHYARNYLPPLSRNRRNELF
jgi:hypothetical protein